jgi:hypothetical protein
MQKYRVYFILNSCVFVQCLLLYMVLVAQSLIFSVLFWRLLFVLLAIVLSVFLLTASDYPFGIFWLPLWYLLITPLVFWLPLWYLLITPLVSSDNPFGIFWLPLLVSSNFSLIKLYLIYNTVLWYNINIKMTWSYKLLTGMYCYLATKTVIWLKHSSAIL